MSICKPYKCYEKHSHCSMEEVKECNKMYLKTKTFICIRNHKHNDPSEKDDCNRESRNRYFLDFSLKRENGEKENYTISGPASKETEELFGRFKIQTIPGHDYTRTT
ncbi:uncharacterized protein LOC134240030 [Saccostrea cucullata]|uniref:uncharacterized protein LOC134240030 n=1 Tax=Saccostrea cuccullata TaxID=36930 RepID=UPI002ED4C52C